METEDVDEYTMQVDGTLLNDSANNSNDQLDSSNIINGPSSVEGCETWHNTFPSTWLPVIARDMGRQRRQVLKYFTYRFFDMRWIELCCLIIHHKFMLIRVEASQ